MKYRSILILVIIFICAGCSTQASLTVHSQPVGAYITEVETGMSAGMAPVAVFYNAEALKQSANAEGCYMIRGFKASWVSGTSTTIAPIKLCGSPTASYNISLNRNPSAPGLDKDLQFSLQLQSIKAQQQQAQAASDAAAAQLWQAWWQTWSASQQNKINCTTSTYGDTTYTNCR